MLGINAEAEADVLEFAGALRILSSGHAGCQVVRDDECHVGVLVDSIQQSGHAGVSECGVADDSDSGVNAGIGSTLGHSH